MIITFLSDTHNKHVKTTLDLPGGDLLIHSGDISSMGYDHEIKNFCNWFDRVSDYSHRIFIAGNHDFGFQNDPEKCKEVIESYKWINYLQDSYILLGDDSEKMVKVWGSPWQPEFYNWAFNLKRMGKELEEKWNEIPEDVDILITHGPAFGYVDVVEGRDQNLGCELLAKRIKEIKPKIHVCGHIHSARGYTFDGDTHYINASVLDERYNYSYKPITIDWNRETNEIVFL